MHKTAIFIIQLCVVFKLFAIKAIKRHFCPYFVTSGWVKAITDFHCMKHAFCYEVISGKSLVSCGQTAFSHLYLDGKKGSG